MKHYLEFRITEEDDGKKIRTFLKSGLGFSTLKIRSVKFTEGGIMLNREPATVGSFLHAGDVLTILRSDSDRKERHLLANPMPLEILYEDDALIILNKPAGMVCHPSRGHLTDSLANGVRAYFDRTDPDANVHLLGRLDRDTSGLVLMAKDGITADILAREKADGTFEKTYIALVEGTFSEASGCCWIPMESYHTEDGILKNRNGTGSEDAKEAVTFYGVLQSTALPSDSAAAACSTPFEDERSVCTALRVRIPTGRMHQIRFHMAELGHPLLGDALYGHGPSERFGLTRHALHACSLKFRHPYTNETVTVTADLPADMKPFIPDTTAIPCLDL